MRIVERPFDVVRALSPWLILWLVLFLIYDQLIQSKVTLPAAEHLMYCVQLLSDIFISWMSYRAYRAQKTPFERRFFGFIFLSILIGMISTEVYNVLVNFLQVKLNESLANEFWIIPYTAFLVIEFFVWLFLFERGLKSSSQSERMSAFSGEKSVVNKPWFSRLPILQSAILIFLFICFTGIFKQSIFSKMGFNQLSNSILETLFFMALTLCLSRLKNKSLCYLATGFLFLITFNLAHRLTYMQHFEYRLFDMAWLLAYIPIIYGFYKVSKNPRPLEFFEENSIHVLTGAIFLAFTGFLFVVFTFLELFIAFLQDRTLSQTFSAFDNTASVLVFTFMLSVISGKVFASYWSGPVEKMMKRIQRAQKYPEEYSKSESPDFMALEVKALDAFIMRTIGDLQTANQIKANFLMNMSHDFRTPASGIYALAKSIYKHQEDENLKRPLSMMIESSFQLMNLLQDVLDFSRFSNQKVGLNLTSINLQELIGGIIALMKPKSEEKKLEMRFEMENLDKSFLSDSTLLQRILINLVSNAIKFTERGFIFLHAKCKEEKGGLKLIIKVQDSGIGIDPKDHDRIFQPFMRLTSSENTENSGIGLGLSNVKSMLEALNGSIAVHSALGQGATFTLEIHEKNS